MNKYTHIMVFFTINVSISLSLVATDFSNHAAYERVDKTCYLVEDEFTPWLKMVKLHEEKGISLEAAAQELNNDLLLINYGKKQLKYDNNAINKAAEEHINRVMMESKKSKEEFSSILMERYQTTFRQYQSDIASAIVLNQVKNHLASQVSISDAQVYDEINRSEALTSTIALIKLSSNKSNFNLRIKKAQEIRNTIKTITSLAELKNHYENDQSISIIGPITYDPQNSDPKIKKKLDEHPNLDVTEPMVDRNQIILIWKLKKDRSTFKKTSPETLEEVRGKLYERAVQAKYDAITKSMGSIVENNGCFKP